MTITVEYEAGTVLDFDYESIIRRVVLQSLDYEKCPYEAQVNVLLTDSQTIRDINLRFRGIDKETDVLSFPMVSYEQAGDFSFLEECPPEDYFDPDSGELLMGDIILCVERIIEQAQMYGHSRKRELGFLVAHSMLHLMGYDDMEEEEREIMEQKQRDIMELVQLPR